MALREVFAAPDIAAEFDDAALVRAMLAFERALALAEARCGIVPADAAGVIAQVCDSAHFDAAQLAADARRAGTLTIPFVKRLTAQVAARDATAARYVHWGATSQDVQDTALALAARGASSKLALRLATIGDALAALAVQHRDTPLTGRTLLQAATPVSFGWKAAVWLCAVTRTRASLAQRTGEAAALQFGGASGVRASLGDAGVGVAESLACELDLPLPGTPWHSVRDAVARLGAEVGIACGVLAKIGRDVSLLMQPEVAEASEPAGEGRGGSSALPHKRNPVGSMYALEAGVRASGLVATMVSGVAGEHERGLGQWQYQWWTLAELYAAAGSAADAMVDVITGLRVDADAMARNLDATRGFVYAEALATALAAKLGRQAAASRVEALVRRAIETASTLAAALDADADTSRLLDAQTRTRLFDARTQLGSASDMIDRALAAWRAG
jgi:3-carboxy-cis,cis-muconate cycloisomerase